MTKIFTAADLTTKSLKELTTIYNEYAPKARATFSCKKEKAVEMTLEVLPEAKAEKAPRKESKVGKLLAALKEGTHNRDELIEITGFDARNLGVSMTILRTKKNMLIIFNKETKIYSLAA